jgi:acid phosphatase type 7
MPALALAAVLAVSAVAKESTVRVHLTPSRVTAGATVVATVSVRPNVVRCTGSYVPFRGTAQRLPARKPVRGSARWRIGVPASSATGSWVIRIACGRAGSSSARLAVTAQPSGDPVIAAAGDIACAPNDFGYNAGKGNGQFCMQAATANLLGNISGLTAVLPLGDEQYECGEAANFAAVYGPTWGRFKAIEHPVVGNHDYGDASECAATSNAAGYYQYFGAAAGVAGQGYYSYNVGAWHLIALNSDCTFIAGGCDVGSPQETWLKNDLASNTATCTLAYWHHPRFSTGPRVGDDSRTAALWNDLLAAHAELVLSGHDHTYQRFAPVDALGNPTPGGLTEIIVGTGGQEHAPVPAPRASLLVSDNTTFGVLKLTLHPTGFSGQFLPAAGSGSFTDSFSGTCA